MNLHISGHRPDWDEVPNENRNIFQKVAAKTDGWVTPANLLDVAGLSLALSASLDINRGKKTWTPIAKLALSRVFDAFDGSLADRTKTKCQKGKFIDALKDKVEVSVASIEFTKKDIFPKSVGIPIVVSQALIASGALFAHLKNKDQAIQPSASGKKTMAYLSFCGGMYALSDALKKSNKEKASEIALLGAHALYGLTINEGFTVAKEYSDKLID